MHLVKTKGWYREKKPVLNLPESTSEGAQKPVWKEDTHNALGITKNTGKNLKSAISVPWGCIYAEKAKLKNVVCLHLPNAAPGKWCGFMPTKHIKQQHISTGAFMHGICTSGKLPLSWADENTEMNEIWFSVVPSNSFLIIKAYLRENIMNPGIKSMVCQLFMGC